MSGLVRRWAWLVLVLAGAFAPVAAATRTPVRRHDPAPAPAAAAAAADDEPTGEDEDEGEEEEDDDGAARPDPVPPNDVKLLLEQTFTDKRFAFCHDSNYPLTDRELRWCSLITKSDPRCPALAHACARGPAARHEGTREPEQNRQILLPELPAFGRILLWLLLGIALALLIGFLARHAIAQRRAPDAPEPESEPDAGAAADPARAQVETDVERLLALARAAAAAGDFGRAIEAVYAALLRKLEGAGFVRVEAHRTNGDHLRDLGQAKPELRPHVAAVVVEVERVEFGGETPTEERFRSVHDRVMGILRVGPSLLLLALCLGATSCRMDRGGWEHSPSGRAGVMALLQKYGFETRERWAGLEKLGGELDQLVLLPAANIEEPGWAALKTWIAQPGHTLIITGNRELPAWLGARSLEDGKPASAPLVLEKRYADDLGRAQLALPPGLRLAERKQANPVVRRGDAVYAATWLEGAGVVFMLADDQLFTNAALLAADNARFMTELLRPGGKRVELAGELTGVVSHDPVTSVRRGRLAPLLIQLALLAVVFFIYKGARFGRPIDPLSGRRRAFAEHARAVGLKYARGRASRHGLEVYGAYALERLRERLNLGPERSLSAMAEAIAARTGRPLGEVMRVLVQAREAATSTGGTAAAALYATPPPPSPEDIVALRQLASMLAQTGGSGERSRVERKV